MYKLANLFTFVTLRYVTGLSVCVMCSRSWLSTLMSWSWTLSSASSPSTPVYSTAVTTRSPSSCRSTRAGPLRKVISSHPTRANHSIK